MAGCLTDGITRSCSTPISGGSKYLYISDRANVTGYTDTGGEITAITMAVGEVFHKFVFAPNTALFTENLTNENCATQVTQQYTCIFRGRNTDYRNAIMELANCCCGMVVIHGENTGVDWIWGLEETEEVFLNSNEGTTGTAKSDPNQETIVLQALATIKARAFTATIPV